MVDIPCVFISFYQKFTDSEILQTLKPWKQRFFKAKAFGNTRYADMRQQRKSLFSWLLTETGWPFYSSLSRAVSHHINYWFNSSTIITYKNIFLIQKNYNYIKKVTQFIVLLKNRHKKTQQLSTFPGGLRPSIIDVQGLNFCVRDGNRCTPLAITTEYG